MPRPTPSLAALVALLGLAAAPHAADARVGCRDMQGNPVDWFIALKFPKMDLGGPSWYAHGFGFAYMDSNSPYGQFKESPVDLTSTSHAIAYTLQQMYGSDDHSDIAYMAWNDDTPSDHTSASRGHSKGTLAYDSETGYYLSHSVPHSFPVKADGYSFADREADYGQDFICLTLRTPDFEAMAQQLQLVYPLVYDSYIPASLLAGSPTMAAVIAGQHLAGEPYTGVHPIMTVGGAAFTSMAKNAAWASDIYEDLVAAQLGDDLRTETWQNGRGKMDSYCKPAKQYNVENIEEISLSPVATWTSTKDHSKIAVSSARTGYVCFGDENRQVSQAKRGGSTICTNDTRVYQAYTALIHKVESC